MKKKENRFAVLGRIIWLYAKYQLLTKGLLSLVIFPLVFFFLNYFIRESGRSSISSGDYLDFLLSFHGLGFLFFVLVLVTILIGFDINAFIMMSALIRERKLAITARQMVFMSFRSLKTFLKPEGFFLMLYVSLVLPLIGVSFTISPMREFQIPNFIMDVVYKTPLYFAAYVAVLSVFTYVSIKYCFVFHFILLHDEKIPSALKRSKNLMKSNFFSFLKDFVGKTLGLFLFILAGIGLVSAGLIYGIEVFVHDVFEQRFFYLFVFLLLSEVMTFVTFMIVPIVADRLTTLFFRYLEKEGQDTALKGYIKEVGRVEDFSGRIRLKTRMAVLFLLIGIMLFNGGSALFLTFFFDDIFKEDREIAVIAHRGGGDLAAENTVESLLAAAKEGAVYSEIDVQRTKDGHYVINHDNTFLRVAGLSKKVSDLTLEEVKKLRVKDLFDEERESFEVATLEEMLTAAKGKIGLFIELKGHTADKKMVDEVVKMIKERDMLSETAILSLDYALIQYAEATYPEVETGFLYFFSVGKTAEMVGDMLIMEEREASERKLCEIREAGKKAIVWTVNKEESIDKFVRKDVDGIITDYVKKVKDGLRRRDERSELEKMIDVIFD